MNRDLEDRLARALREGDRRLVTIGIDWERVKVLRGETNVARFLAECEQDDDGTARCFGEVFARVRSGDPVWRWYGKNVIMIDVAHLRREVYEVPAGVEIKPVATS